MDRKEITISVNKDTASDLADILCYFAGLADAKGESWKEGKSWLINANRTLRDVKMEIQDALEEVK